MKTYIILYSHRHCLPCAITQYLYSILNFISQIIVYFSLFFYNFHLYTMDLCISYLI